jgi:Lon protease-like protein
MQKLVYLQCKIEWFMERIPIFPLSAVVFPGEFFNLHIFEPRYKQLIQDIELKNSAFGIPYIDNKTPGDFGSEVRLHKVLNRYPGGELDITVEGIGVFEIQSFTDSLEGKLYSDGLVSKRIESTPVEQSSNLGMLLHEYLILGKNPDEIEQTEFLLSSYEAAIILKMHPQKKYRLIQIESEQKRQNWLSNELKLLIQSRKMELQLDKKFILN